MMNSYLIGALESEELLYSCVELFINEPREKFDRLWAKE